LLYHSVGVGKTLLSLQMTSGGKTLVLVKKSLKFQWEQIVAEFKFNAVVLTFNDANIDNFAEFNKHMSRKDIHFIIIDEVHSFNKQIL
jgi:hypothetical protein